MRTVSNDISALDTQIQMFVIFIHFKQKAYGLQNYQPFTWGGKKILIEITFNWKNAFFHVLFSIGFGVCARARFFRFSWSRWLRAMLRVISWSNDMQKHNGKKRYFTLRCKSFVTYWVTLMDCDSRYKVNRRVPKWPVRYFTCLKLIPPNNEWNAWEEIQTHKKCQ